MLCICRPDECQPAAVPITSFLSWLLCALQPPTDQSVHPWPWSSVYGRSQRGCARDAGGMEDNSHPLTPILSLAVADSCLSTFKATRPPS
ncbi:hypothetical protein BJY04DRAFT_175400 [Aspergillus karnatakaensis]|uniref:uncharacterized protein n=1 Tax=Aspergillus karnatakaensis TaxID=1810916 RepID=UPI003CCD5776